MLHSLQTTVDERIGLKCKYDLITNTHTLEIYWSVFQKGKTCLSKWASLTSTWAQKTLLCLKYLCTLTNLLYRSFSDPFISPFLYLHLHYFFPHISFSSFAFLFSVCVFELSQIRLYKKGSSVFRLLALLWTWGVGEHSGAGSTVCCIKRINALKVKKKKLKGEVQCHTCSNDCI